MYQITNNDKDNGDIQHGKDNDIGDNCQPCKDECHTKTKTMIVLKTFNPAKTI